MTAALQSSGWPQTFHFKNMLDIKGSSYRNALMRCGFSRCHRRTFCSVSIKTASTTFADHPFPPQFMRITSLTSAAGRCPPNFDRESQSSQRETLLHGDGISHIAIPNVSLLERDQGLIHESLLTFSTAVARSRSYCLRPDRKPRTKNIGGTARIKFRTNPDRLR